MRSYIAGLALAIASVASGQDFLGDERAWIKRSMLVPDSNYAIFLDSSALRLYARLDGPHPVRSEFYFLGEPESEDFCDSIVHRYACSPCFERDVQRLISDYGNDWLLMDDGRYVTPKGRYRTWSKGDTEKSLALPVLGIVRDPGAEICGTLTLSYLVLPKSQAKELVKSLRCAGRGAKP